MSRTTDNIIEIEESGESHSPKLLTQFDVSDRIEDNKEIAIIFLDMLLVREQIKPFNLKVIDSTSFHSGGGCLHYFLHLSDKRVLTFHHTDDVEISHKKWNSIDDYLDASGDQYDGDEHLGYIENGFGWEFQSPDYDNRCFQFPFEILMMIIKD
mgnify:CR=1 FL=1